MSKKKAVHYCITRESDNKVFSAQRLTRVIARGFDKSFLLEWGLKEMQKTLQEKLVRKNWLSKIFLSSKKKYSISKKDIVDAKLASRRIGEEAKSVGSEVHALIEKHIRYSKNNCDLLETLLVDKRREVKNSFKAFLKWEKWNVKEWLLSEQIVANFSEEFPVAGRFDALAILKNDECALIDFKTTKNIYPEHILQVAAYSCFFKKSRTAYRVEMPDSVENFNISAHVPAPEAGIVLRLDKVTAKPFEKRIAGKQLVEQEKMFLTLCNYLQLETQYNLKGQKIC